MFSVQPRTLYHCSCHCPDIYTTPKLLNRAESRAFPLFPEMGGGGEGGEQGCYHCVAGIRLSFLDFLSPFQTTNQQFSAPFILVFTASAQNHIQGPPAEGNNVPAARWVGCLAAPLEVTRGVFFSKSHPTFSPVPLAFPFRLLLLLTRSFKNNL